MPRRRVVVTGMGFITPLGDDKDRIFERAFSGQSGITRVQTGREGWEAELLVGKAEWRADEEITPLQRITMDPVSQMAFAAARRALTQAGLAEDETALSDAGVYVGCSIGGAVTNEQGYETYYTRNVRRTKPTSVARVMPNAPAAHVSMQFGIHGPSHTYSVACASSATAIGEAFRAVRDGYVDCVVAGGAEAMLADGVLASWEAMGVLATEHPDGPGASVRPFDVARTGFALAEGAGMLILEAEEHARARGAEVLGEILGYGASSDAFNLTQPSREGQVRAIRASLADAGLPPQAVGYVNAHATGTKVGDIVELQAMKEVFGEGDAAPPVSSTKSMHGHLIGAAGAVELGLTLMALGRGRIPPTANLTDPDPECDLDCVPLVGREVPGLEVALSNSFAFGGANVSLVVRRAEG